MPIIGVLPSDYTPPILLEYLIIAGGGSGYAAGGGAGGVVSNVGQPMSVSVGESFDIVVGAGGAIGVNGSNSSFENIVAIGGGSGGGNEFNGSNGGSGGGGIPNSYSSNVNLSSDTILASVIDQSDRLILCGKIATWNGQAVEKILRLNSNGSIDQSFINNIGTGPGPKINFSGLTVKALALQPDGKILAGGVWINWNGVASKNIARLNADGTLDSSFSSNIGSGPNQSIDGINVQSTGKIIVYGLFTDWNGTQVNNVVRLNTDGTLDTTFITNIGTAGNNIKIASIQPDDKIIFGGDFTDWAGNFVKRVVRINANGSYDSTFTTNVGSGPNDTVLAVFPDTDGSIYVGGEFSSWNGITARGMTKLNSDGTQNTTFSANHSTSPQYGYPNTDIVLINGIKKSPSGNLAVIGRFREIIYQSGQSFPTVTTYGGVIKVATNGLTDHIYNQYRYAAFKENNNNGWGEVPEIRNINIASSGSMFISGEFTSVNDVSANYIHAISSSWSPFRYFKGEFTATGSGGSGIPGQGNDGGANTGGGGGAGADGNDGSTGYPMGGVGIGNIISGTAKKFAGGGSGISNNFVFGGDGGGGNHGGAPANIGYPGGVNSGGGGGGGFNFYDPTIMGNNGGSGIVILKYPKEYALDISSSLYSVTYQLGSRHKVTEFWSGAGTVTFTVV